ncbi:hypothetical protein IWX49DRAFT_566390 [Phyllosticta citricarpa]|uniref:Uncharacterized protein n=1 Tax=Phyllosticta citricarpa TaxID=55181 RepID=A0ABR1ME45_9PEZI
MTVSPKRKRGPSDPATPTPFAPRINTSAFPGPCPATSHGDPHTAPLQHSTVGSESPRTRVAREFGHLQLEAGPALPKIDFGTTLAAESSSMNTKKAKHVYEQPDSFGLDSANGTNGFGHYQHVGSYSPPPQPVLEIAETPQPAFGSRVSQAAMYQQQLSPPTPSSSPSVKLFLSSTGRRQDGSKLRAPSPPPDSVSSTSSPAATTNTSPVDLSNLTWQESEITGHLIDVEREDDGYGINGVGFRPTHAVAQQRVLKRRQQILEWRAREAREARQKRSERRRLGASMSERKIGEVPKRVVRFAS